MANRNNAVHPNVAADRLGVPVDCIYERIRQGELAVRKDGDRWLVVLDHADATDRPRAPEQLHGFSIATVPTPAQPIPPPDPALLTLTRQLFEHGDQLDEIRRQIAALQASIQRLAIDSARPQPTQPATSEPPDAATHVRRHPLRQRPRLLALAMIVTLVLGGSAIQTSAAQRADDLTVAFVFACGAVTGAIVTWLAADKWLTPQPETNQVDAPHAVVPRVTPSLHPSDGDA